MLDSEFICAPQSAQTFSPRTATVVPVARCSRVVGLDRLGSIPIAELTQIESQLRTSLELRERLARLSAQRDAGVHAVGDIWRRERLTCLTRAQLGSYLLGAMTDEEIEYAEFHLNDVGCRYCQANLADLRSQQSDTAGQVAQRRARFFQTSVGRVGKK